MIISYWDTKDSIVNDYRLNIIDKNESWFVGCITNDDCAQLSSVEIETINRCNNDCSFCPVSRNNDKRTLIRMEEDLFKKIIKDLKDINYTGYLSLFSNNEPLLDNRIFDWIDYAKKELPQAAHALYTNGLLLDEMKYRRLTKSLDYLVIDNYNDDMELNSSVKRIKDGDSEYTDGCKVRVWVRKKNQVLENRGGLAPNKKTDNIYQSSCVLPFFQMVIRPDGKVSRCCQDAYGYDTLGDLNVDSVWDIWNGKKYEALRNNLKNGRKGLKACSTCDQFGLNNYYPVEWEGMYFQKLIEWIKVKKKNGRNVLLCNEHGAIFLYESLKFCEVSADGFFEVNNNVFSSKDVYILLCYNFEIIEKLKNNGLRIVDDFVVYEKNKYQNMVRIDKKKYCESIKTIEEADKNKQIIIFGAGNKARQIIEGYHLHPYMIVDNSKELIGTKIHGKLVDSAKLLNKDMIGDCIILNATSYYSDIAIQLEMQGISLEKLFDGNCLL